MTNRPTSITVIGWILIVLGVVGFLGILPDLNSPDARELMAKSPIPISVQYTMSFLGLAISVLSGYGVLQGMNWARYLYVIWSVIGIGTGLATSPFKLMIIPSLVVFLIIAFYFFRPKANAFFSGAQSDDGP